MIRSSARFKSPVQVCLSSEAIDPLKRSEANFDQLRKLTEISRALTYTTSLDEVTRLTVVRGAVLLNASQVVLMLPNEDDQLCVKAASGVTSAKLGALCVPLGDELVNQLGELMAVDSNRLLAVPLIVGGQVTGILAAAITKAYTDDDEWLLSALADQAAVALENARVGGEVRTGLETRLRASETATGEKDRALSTLAHDIRTPLGAIDAYSSILEDELFGPINDRQRETLGRVRMSARHLLSLLENVMEMARITAGALRTTSEPVRLIDAVRDAVQMLIPSADTKFQVLNTEERNVALVAADPARVRQVLVNLIGNAVKFTPPDGVISVTVGYAFVDGKHWGEIRVQDSGPGIAADELKLIFEPYYRSQVTASTPGVGLGLAISYALVAAMHGHLEIASTVGQGTCMIVRLPAVKSM